MKPFNLEKALAGEPVITRDGRPARVIDGNNKCWKPVVAWIGNEVYRFDSCGWVTTCYESPTDLFMAEKPKIKKSGWINLYNHKEHIATYVGKVYDTEEEAIKADLSWLNRLSTIQVTWEEEQ